MEALALFKIVQLDSSDEQSILNAAEKLQGVPIDLLINNAGMGVRHDLATTTKEDLIQHFTVNAVGPFLVTRAFLPNLKLAVAQNDSALVANLSTVLSSKRVQGRQLRWWICIRLPNLEGCTQSPHHFARY